MAKTNMEFSFKVIVTGDTFKVVNIETGEVQENKIPKKVSKKNTVEESSEPLLTLDSNKYYLTSSAVSLLNVEAGDRIDIKYEKKYNKLVPVIGSNSVFNTQGGNKLSKNNTVSCRGKANEELSKYGTVFALQPKGNGLFYLVNTENPKEDSSVIEDANIELPSQESEFDLDDLINNSGEATQISSLDFSI